MVEIGQNERSPLLHRSGSGPGDTLGREADEGSSSAGSPPGVIDGLAPGLADSSVAGATEEKNGETSQVTPKACDGSDVSLESNQSSPNSLHPSDVEPGSKKQGRWLVWLDYICHPLLQFGAAGKSAWTLQDTNGTVHEHSNDLYDIKQKLNGMDQKLNGMDQKLNGMEPKLDGMDQTLNRMDQTLNRIEDLLQKLVTNLKGITPGAAKEESIPASASGAATEGNLDGGT